MKKLLVLENDPHLSRENHDIIYSFMDNYDGDIKTVTRFYQKSNIEIYELVKEADDIAFQTVFYGESEYAVEGMCKILSKIKESKNIFICLALEPDVELRRLLTEEDFYNIKHHNIYQYKKYGNKKIKLDFSDMIEKHQKVLDQKAEDARRLEEYKNSRKKFPTGRKIKIKKILANGNEWSNLKEGDIVDELDCDEIDPNPNRGVWVWGVTEPVKLLSDSGYDEYEIVFNDNKTVDDILEKIIKTTDLCWLSLSDNDYTILQSLVESSSDNKSNVICEHFNIQKRRNRSKIDDILN